MKASDKQIPNTFAVDIIKAGIRAGLMLDVKSAQKFVGFLKSVGYTRIPELTLIKRKNDPDETPKGWTQRQKEDYIIGYVIGHEDGSKAQLAHTKAELGIVKENKA